MSTSLSRNGHTPAQLLAPTEFVDLQRGTLLVNVLAVTSALTIVATIVWSNILTTVALIWQLAAAVCYCTLFLRIKDGELLWQYGPGWIRGKVALSEIERVRMVTTRFPYGRGFSLNGVPALEIDYAGGRCLRLSTPRAEELRNLIEHAPERRIGGSSC